MAALIYVGSECSLSSHFTRLSQILVRVHCIGRNALEINVNRESPKCISMEVELIVVKFLKQLPRPCTMSHERH